MRRNEIPKHIGPEHGPFTYTYIAVTAVPGIKLPEDTQGDLNLFSFPEQNGEAFLTRDWDPYCVYMDRSNAIGSLMLTAFRGPKRFGRFSVLWHRLMVGLLGESSMFKKRLERETEVVRKKRYKRYNNVGCYLVYKAEGDLIEPIKLNAARKFGSIGFGIDVLQGESYRSIHRSAVYSSATGFSLGLLETNGSPNMNFIGDVIFLNGKDGLLVYLKTVGMGNVNVVMTSSWNGACLDTAKELIPGIVSDSRIETAITLFLESQNKKKRQTSLLYCCMVSPRTFSE